MCPDRGGEGEAARVKHHELRNCVRKQSVRCAFEPNFCSRKFNPDARKTDVRQHENFNTGATGTNNMETSVPVQRVYWTCFQAIAVGAVPAGTSRLGNAGPRHTVGPHAARGSVRVQPSSRDRKSRFAKRLGTRGNAKRLGVFDLRVKNRNGVHAPTHENGSQSVSCVNRTHTHTRTHSHLNP